MLSKKQRQSLRDADRRRARRPAQLVPPETSLKAPGHVENRMIRDHQDVLQNIEFALASAYREDQRVDDAVIDAVLQAAIRGQRPEDPAAVNAFSHLAAIRQMRDDVPDQVWIDGLRTVYASLKRHSERRSGDTDYLDFVLPYVP